MEFKGDTSGLSIGDKVKVVFKWFAYDMEPKEIWIETTIIGWTYSKNPIVLYLHPTDRNYQKIALNE